MINIAELLKDAPRGMKLYSPLFGEVEFSKINSVNAVEVIVTCTDGTQGIERFHSNGTYISRCPNAECLIFPSKVRRTWEEWKLPIEPKFKVGSWLYHNSNGVRPVLVTDYDERHGYQIQDGSGRYHLSRNLTENEYHLWSIADAKDGDVLAVDWNEEDGHVQKDGSVKWQKIVIFKSISEVGVEGYGCTFRNNKLAFDTDVPYYSTTWTRTLKPATKKQRDLLFQKMKEEGYVWDDEKKELKKIQPHYDIANFHAGMPVLVRADNNCRWDYSVFSRITGNEDWQFAVCNGVSFTQCIPFEGNETLLGTTVMCNEQYINW